MRRLTLDEAVAVAEREVARMVATGQWCPDRPWPRRGEPWSPAEDDRLLQLVRQALKKYPNKSMYAYGPTAPAHDVAKVLMRTPSAVMTRYAILRTCGKRCEGRHSKESRG